MQGYEMFLIFDPALGAEKIDAIVAKVEEKLKSFGVTEFKTDKWGIKRLASIMRKAQKLQQAFYVFVSFKSETSVPAKMSAYLKVTENILRYAINKEVVHPVSNRQPREAAIEAVSVGEIKDEGASVG